jgi:MacB-like periplasmic core domain
MGNLLQDIRYAIRQIRKSPGFAITIVATLALGIGANTAAFSVMNAVQLRMLPVHEPERLIYLSHAGLPGSVGNSGDYPHTFGINVYQRLRADGSAFSDIIAYVPLSFTKTAVRFGDSPEEIAADEVSGNFFAALGVPMAIGQSFAAADEDRHSQLAVISYRYWTRRFDRDPGVLGKPIFVNGVPFTITGVAGPRFRALKPGRYDDRSMATPPEQRQPKCLGNPRDSDEYPLRQSQLVQPDADGADETRSHRRPGHCPGHSALRSRGLHSAHCWSPSPPPSSPQDAQPRSSRCGPCVRNRGANALIPLPCFVSNLSPCPPRFGAGDNLVTQAD